MNIKGIVPQTRGCRRVASVCPYTGIQCLKIHSWDRIQRKFWKGYTQKSVYVCMYFACTTACRRVLELREQGLECRLGQSKTIVGILGLCYFHIKGLSVTVRRSDTVTDTKCRSSHLCSLGREGFLSFVPVAQSGPRGRMRGCLSTCHRAVGLQAK